MTVVGLPVTPAHATASAEDAEAALAVFPRYWACASVFFRYVVDAFAVVRNVASVVAKACHVGLRVGVRGRRERRPVSS